MRLGSLTVCAVLGSALAARADEGPRLHTPEFSVDLPTGAVRTQDTMPTPIGPVPMVRWMAERTAFAVVFSYGDYPDRSHSPTKVLEGVRDGTMKGLSATLVDEKAVSIAEPQTGRSWPGRHIVATAKAEGRSIVVELRLYLVRNRLYQLLVVRLDGAARPPEYDRMLETFRLAPGPAAAPEPVATVETGEFSVELPKNMVRSVEHVSTPAGDVSQVSWTMTGKRVAYGFVYGDYPVAIVSPEGALDGARDGNLRGMHTELVEEKRITITQGPRGRVWPGRVILSKAPGVRGETTMYSVGRRLYQLSLILEEGEPRPPEYDRMLASFRLKAARRPASR